MFIYRFEDFLKQTHSLSELKTYPQLLQRSDRIGYTIQKVVFRGYHASDQLQVHRKYCCHTESCIDNIFTLSENISFIYTSFRNRLFLLNAACLPEKQQIPVLIMVFGLT
jgi:hypothetical protein